MNNNVLGIDIGGSHITAALIDMETRTLIAGSFQRRAVDSNGPADQIIAAWCDVINAAYKDFDVAAQAELA